VTVAAGKLSSTEQILLLLAACSRRLSMGPGLLLSSSEDSLSWVSRAV